VANSGRCAQAKCIKLFVLDEFTLSGRVVSDWCQKAPASSPGLLLVRHIRLIYGEFFSTLGRARTCDLLIRSQTRSRTGGDREGHRETKQRFYQEFSTPGGTGRDRWRHRVVVPLWYERAANLWCI
jgi:hypothetical protein